jgi:hypothetical protein
MNLGRIFVNLFQFNRTNWKAVALCFTAAAIFWLFNSFNKNYATNIRFPLRFDYAGEKYIPLASLPQHVTMNVSGNGWDLFRKSVGIKLPELKIVLLRPTEAKKIMASSLIPSFSEQLGSGLQINYMVTDTLRVQIDELDSHKFRLAADLSQISYRDGYGRISPVVILPDSVKLQGARSLLHQLPDSIVLVLPKVNLNERLKREVEVLIPNGESITRNPPVVSVMFEVGQLEVSETYVSVKASIPNPTVKVSYVDSVKVKFRIPKVEAENFNEDRSNVQAFIDMKGKSKGIHRMRPKLNRLANYMEVISIDSISIRLY